MNKKLTPFLIILALIVVGGIGFMMGQGSSPVSADSLPEDPQIENASVEDVDYFELVDDRVIMWPITDVNVYVEPNETAEVVVINPKGLTVLLMGIGHGSYADWYYISGCVKGNEYVGYVQREYLSLEEVEMDKNQPSQILKPVEQKPVEQKPVEQKPSNNYVIPGAVSGEDFIDGTEHGKITDEDIKATEEALDRIQGTIHPVGSEPVQQKPSSNAQKPSSDAQKPVEQKPSSDVQKPVEQKPVEQKPSEGSGGNDNTLTWEEIKNSQIGANLTEEQKEADRKATQEAVDRTQGTLHPN